MRGLLSVLCLCLAMMLLAAAACADLVGLAVGPRGQLYCVEELRDAKTATVRELDASGRQLRLWQVPRGARDVVAPVGIAVGPEGTVFVAESYYGIRRFSATGRHLGDWSLADAAEAVAVDRSGSVYVIIDYTVRKLDHSGKPRLTFGSWGTGEGQFVTPRSIAVDSQGRIYVLDTAGSSEREIAGKPVRLESASRVQVFDPSGHYLRTLSTVVGGKDRKSNLQAVAVGPQDTVYVLDIGGIFRYDPRGNLLGHRDAPGLAADSLAVGADGNLYTGQSGLTGTPAPAAAHLRKYGPDGKLLATWTLHPSR